MQLVKRATSKYCRDKEKLRQRENGDCLSVLVFVSGEREGIEIDNRMGVCDVCHGFYRSIADDYVGTQEKIKDDRYEKKIFNGVKMVLRKGRRLEASREIFLYLKNMSKT